MPESRAFTNSVSIFGATMGYAALAVVIGLPVAAVASLLAIGVREARER